MNPKSNITAIALLALAALALAPTGAAGKNDPVLTYPTGTQLAAGSSVRAGNVGAVSFTGATGTTTCTTAALEGSLTKNNGSEVEVEVKSASFAGDGVDGRCTNPTERWVKPGPSTNGTPWCLRSTPELATDEFQLRGGACSKSPTPIRLSFSKAVVDRECIYEREPAISGTYSTHPSSAVLTMSKWQFARVGGHFLCPTGWSIDISLALEKDEAGVKPFYVSGGPRLTYPTGTTLSAGSTFRARNTSEVVFTDESGSVLFSCSGAELKGTVVTNSGTAIEGEVNTASITGSGTGGACPAGILGNTEWTFGSATNGLPWCLRATSGMVADEFQIRGNSCAGASRPIRLVSETTVEVVECVYERQAALTGTYKTHPEDALLQFSGAVFLEAEPRQAACPDETTLDASLTLERNEAGTKPIFIS